MTSSSQKWIKNTQICESCTTGRKNIKIRNYDNFGLIFFFFLMEEFLSFETLIIVVTTLFHLCGMYKLGPFLTKFCVNDVKTGNKVLKIIKLDSQLMKGGGVIYVGIFFFRLSGAP